MNGRNFFAELKRRNVYKVTVAYAVVGWLVMQVAATIVPALHLPGAVTTAVVVLVLLGFPVALVLAWAFEMTPEGIARTDEAGELPKARSGRAWIYVVAIGAAFSIALFFLGRYTAGGGRAASSIVSSDKSIAVLPLVNQSGDAAQEYFSDGLSEELINVLGQIRELRVIGRNSSFRFKGKAEDARAVGQALRVGHVLEGSVRKAGDRVRISVQLVDASDDSQRWSQTYDRELKDVFAVQEEIARAVADELRVTLTGAARNALARPSNQNLDAYKAYLEGQFHFAQRTGQSDAKALASFEEAVRLDPNYAEAYFGKSRIFSYGALSQGAQGRAALEQARKEMLTARALKPGLAAAHAGLAYIHAMLDWDLAAAAAELSRADSQDSFVLNVAALVRRIAGELEEAAALHRKGIERDPAFVGWYNNFATTLLQLGRYEEAEAMLRKALELQPGADTFHSYLALVASLRGQADVALREAQLEPDPVGRATSLAVAHHALGDRTAADAALESLIAQYGENFPLQVAFVYAGRGEADHVFDWLNRACVARQPVMVTFAGHPLFKPYRSDPRFLELCRKMNIPAPK